MIAIAALLVITAPPLTPGIHRCGVQWSEYSELCTVTADGEGYTIASSGPSTKLSGKLVPVDENNFTLDGHIEVADVPIGYGTLTVCDEKGPFKFRHTGKRKYFRHTQTCKDMTTTYFDIFIDIYDPSKLEPTKKLSAMMGNIALDPLGNSCSPVDAELVKLAGDPVCLRWNDSGLGSPYYDCAMEKAGGRLYIFQKKKSCTDIAERRKDVQ